MQQAYNLASVNQQEWRTLLRSSVDFPRDDFQSVLDIAYRWIGHVYRRSFGNTIPGRFATSSRNEYEPPGHTFSWVTIDNPASEVKKLFSAKIQHPDQHEPLRFWVTEFEIAETDSKTIFGLRLAAFGRDVDSIIPAVPKLLRQLAERGASHAGLPCNWNGKIAANESDVRLLADFVSAKDRVLPLVVVSERLGDDGVWRQLLDRLSKRLGGVSIIVGLENSATFEWARLLGPQLHVFQGAVRVYLPNTGSETFAPLLLHDRSIDGQTLSPEDWVSRWVFRSSVNSRAWVDRHAFYQTARQILMRQELKAHLESASAAEQSVAMVAYYEKELDTLKIELDAERAENRNWVAEIEKLEEQLDELTDDKRRLLYKLNVSYGQFAEKEPDKGMCVVPADLEEMRDWYEDSAINQRLFIATRALREAQQSLYHDPSSIYKALLYLADEHRDMHLYGTPESRATAIAKLQEIGWQCEGAGGETTLTRDQYRVLFNGRWLTTELHLTKGGGRDPRFNARIYFTWDDTAGMCVIGWLPTHLENTLT